MVRERLGVVRMPLVQDRERKEGQHGDPQQGLVAGGEPEPFFEQHTRARRVPSPMRASAVSGEASPDSIRVARSAASTHAPTPP